MMENINNFTSYYYCFLILKKSFRKIEDENESLNFLEIV
ncbi:hypothetical protein RIEPE_0372 [Candidatus Riesia pediculicola USDA]|uniref:Uncharacterized protein n=1 Tax=Riesia pediculicola (strain USDA) TaxID=515618 RepID=D4G8G0_RIEPU|nr:hypothetical protein RIEPE_0372 [Candidatus Riesia pediculicola USDA]